MKISGIDANLLVALDALLRERNVTRAAARLGIGQPALSHSLARLREHFKDPLLIPRGRELVLSDKASRLAASVASAAAALTRVFEERIGGFRKEPEFAPFFKAVQPFIPNIEEMRHYEPSPIHWSRPAKP